MDGSDGSELRNPTLAGSERGSRLKPTATPKNKIEKGVWKRVQRAQAKGEPLPMFEGEEADALRALLTRYTAQQEAAAKEQAMAAVAKRLRTARRWAYSNLPGFTRHQGLPHPLLIPWAKENGDTAGDEEWIRAAMDAHKREPIPLEHYYNTAPVGVGAVGRVERIKAVRPTIQSAPAAT